MWLMFRSATPSSGVANIVKVTATLSVTVPASSTLGFQNATPGRIWIAAVNNGGAVSLSVINCLAFNAASAGMYPLAGWGIANITAFGGGANNAQVFYGAKLDRERALWRAGLCDLGGGRDAGDGRHLEPHTDAAGIVSAQCAAAGDGAAIVDTFDHGPIPERHRHASELRRYRTDYT